MQRRCQTDVPYAHRRLRNDALDPDMLTRGNIGVTTLTRSSIDGRTLTGSNIEPVFGPDP